ELQQPYRVARSLIAVARSIASTTYKAPPDLADVVAAEAGLIEGHAGGALSPILGVPMDYSGFVAPSASAHPGLFRALAWLGSAPLGLVAKTEAAGSPLDVGRARSNARAAMLIARACDR